MNWERIERRFIGIVVVLIFCATHRDWGVFGQIAVLGVSLAYAVYVEWTTVRERRRDELAGHQ
jgi:hypothetical protein